MNNGIPVLHCSGEGLAAAWENSLLRLNICGMLLKTQYDKPDEPPSLDSSMCVTVNNPMSEPMIHRCIPDSLYGLHHYAQALLHGVDDSKYGDTYTYYRRLRQYLIINPKNNPQQNTVINVQIDQIQAMIHALVETPHTRRAQAIIWDVGQDIHDDHAPCLQRIWCRMTRDPQNIYWLLNMNVSIRSNDAFKAAFMNMYAFVYLQKHMADMISGMRQENVIPGRYCHFADSYHVYGKDFPAFNGLLKRVRTTDFADRTWNLFEVQDKLFTKPSFRVSL
jgi:thymidylate synthase